MKRANRSARINNEKSGGNLMLLQFPRGDAKAIEFGREVERTGHHDEECCNGSALPRHDPSKKKQSGFGIIIAKTRGACVITRFWPNQEMGRK